MILNLHLANLILLFQYLVYSQHVKNNLDIVLIYLLFRVLAEQKYTPSKNILSTLLYPNFNFASL